MVSNCVGVVVQVGDSDVDGCDWCRYVKQQFMMYGIVSNGWIMVLWQETCY